MNKQELIDKVAMDIGAKKKDVEAFINSFQSNVVDTLKKGKKVQLVNFMTISVAKRAARKGVNPRTRKAITIPAKKVPKFTPGKMLKDAVK